MMKSNIKAYFMRVGYKGYFGSLQNTLEAKQKYVGGLIQVVTLNGVVDIICNEEGKVMGLPVNRAILDEDGKPVDILVGDIVAVRHDEEGNFTDIHEEDIQIIRKYLRPVYLTEVTVVEKGEPKVLNVVIGIEEDDLEVW